MLLSAVGSAQDLPQVRHQDRGAARPRPGGPRGRVPQRRRRLRLRQEHAAASARHLDRPDKGEIHLDGRRIDNLPSERRDRLRNQTFGFIFQFYHLLPELTALENVLMPQMIAHSVLVWLAQRRELQQPGRRTARSRRPGPPAAPSAARTVRRRDAARRHRPRPHQSAARPAGRRADRQPRRRERAAKSSRLLRDLNRQEGLTIIMVTHNMDIVAGTDRVVRLVQGRVESRRTRLQRRPGTESVEG